MAKAKAVSGQLDLFTILSCVYTKTVESLEKEAPKPIASVPDEPSTTLSTGASEKALSKITYYGKSKAAREQTKKLVESLPLTGVEVRDRRILQKALDEHNGLADVGYDGNSVYPSKKLVKEILRMQKTGSLEKMSVVMYQFLSLNFDIAHYDKNGFISYYDGSWDQFYCETLRYSMKRIPFWKSDVRQILIDAGLLDNVA